MDRRQFLSTSSIAAGAALLPLPARAVAQTAAPAASGDARLNAVFEEIFQDRVKRNPGLATSLGLDKGANAHLKSELDVRPAAQARREDTALAKRDLARIKAVPPASLSDAGKLNRDVVIYQIESGLIPAEKFNIDGVQRPYPIFQQGGAYFSTPDFLNSAHTIENAADAEAYLSRLALVGKSLDVDTENQRELAGRGFLAPAWSIDLTLGADAQASRARSGGEHDGGFHRPPHPRKEHRRRLAGARGEDRRRQRLPRARPADRLDGAAEADLQAG